MTYFKAWQYWRRGNVNGPVYQVFVLLGFAKSQTFEVIKNRYGVK